MKKKRLKKKKYIIPFFIIVAALFLSGIFLQFSFQKSSGEPPPSRYIMVYPKPDGGKKTLQLQTFTLITLPPAPSSVPSPSILPSPSSSQPSPQLTGLPSNMCPVDGLRPTGSTCKCIDNNAIACPASNGQFSRCSPPAGMPVELPILSGKWYCIQVLGFGLTEPAPTAPPGCTTACVYKPVVYLYPQKPTSVSVLVRVPGKVIVSDPLYPEGGWKNVLAFPDGTLDYQEKTYKELFYETSLTKHVAMPETGIVIPINELEKQLRFLTGKLGLITHEQQEFLDFWIPVVKHMQTPYVFFSIVSPEVKESIDHLDISPLPQTRIEFIAYFKPLQKPINIKPLVFPALQQRVGFTEVEWGGMIGE